MVSDVVPGGGRSVRVAVAESFSPEYGVHCVVPTERGDEFLVVVSREGGDGEVFRVLVDVDVVLCTYLFLKIRVDSGEARREYPVVDEVLDGLG